MGVTVIVEAPLAPGEAMLTGVLKSAKPRGGGGAFTVTATLAVLVLAMRFPLESTAFTNSSYCPGVVPGCVWILSVVVVGAFPEIVIGGMDEKVGTSFAPPR